MIDPDQEETAETLDEALDGAGDHTGAVGGAGLGALAGGLLLGRARRSLRTRRPSTRLLRRFGLGLLIVCSSVATCSFGVDPASLTAAYGDPVPSSTEDAARVLTRGADAIQGAPESRSLRLTMTEAEATSALSLGLMLPELMRAADRIPQADIQQAPDLEALRERIWQEADAQRSEIADRLGFTQRMLMKLDPKLRTGDVQVRFEPSGQVVVAGYVQAWRFKQPGLFVVAPQASNGELSLDFVSGRLGRMPLPEFVFDWFGQLVASAVLLGREHAQVSEITVGDGTLTFEGRLGS
jgi:hypothetical protein